MANEGNEANEANGTKTFSCCIEFFIIIVTIQESCGSITFNFTPEWNSMYSGGINASRHRQGTPRGFQSFKNIFTGKVSQVTLIIGTVLVLKEGKHLIFANTFIISSNVI